MKIKPIKRSLRDLSLADLKKRKEQILSFLIDNPKIERRAQGFETLNILYELIESKENKDEFLEALVKGFFFE